MRFNLHLMKFLPRSVVLGVATLGNLGYLTKMPGTIGSLFGILFYYLFLYDAKISIYFIVTAVFLYLGIKFCSEAQLRMQKHDPSEIIFDEFAVIPLVFAGLRPLMDEYSVWLILALGFALFRFFDIVKPLGIKKFQDLEDGVGVVMDDVVAALWANLVIQGGFYLYGEFGYLADSVLKAAI